MRAHETVVLELVDQFLAVESKFVGKDLDAANLELVKANKDTLDKVDSHQLCSRCRRYVRFFFFFNLSMMPVSFLRMSGTNTCRRGLQVVALNLAHRKLKQRVSVILALLRGYEASTTQKLVAGPKRS